MGGVLAGGVPPRAVSSLVVFPPARGVWGLLPLQSLCRALQLAIMDVSHTAPSGGSAPDDFVTQGRASRSKRGGSAPAGATLLHLSWWHPASKIF